MILYFNKNGQLLERLEYGQQPRVGMTAFQIFAYFDGINLDEYGAALIRFKRPDINGSEYPDLFMNRAQIFYDKTIEQSNFYNEDNNPYVGYIFDFSEVMNDETIVTMLDTPGMWQASITLVNTRGGSNVTGLIQFPVGGAVSGADDEATELDYSVITRNIAGAVASKVDKSDTLYIRFHEDLIPAATGGTLLKSAFLPHMYVWDAMTEAVYEITAVYNNTLDVTGSTVFADLTKRFDFENPDFDSISVTDMFFVMDTPDFSTVGGLILKAKAKEGSTGTCVTFVKGNNAVFMVSVYANSSTNFTVSKIKFPFPGVPSSSTKGYTLRGEFDAIKDVPLFAETADWSSQEFITDDKVTGANIQNGEVYPVSGGKVYSALLLKVDKTQKIAGIDLEDDITDNELINALFVVTDVTITKEQKGDKYAY